MREGRIKDAKELQLTYQLSVISRSKVELKEILLLEENQLNISKVKKRGKGRRFGIRRGGRLS